MGDVAVGLISRSGINGVALLKGDNGPMDDTTASQRISELAELDPAEAVDAAEALADDLEAGLAEPADGAGAVPEEGTQRAGQEGEQPDPQTT